MAGVLLLRLNKSLLIGILLLILFDIVVGQSFRQFTRNSRQWMPTSLRGQMLRSFPRQQNIGGFRSSLMSPRSRLNSLFFDDPGIQPDLWNNPLSSGTDMFSQPQVIRKPAPNLSEVRVPGVRRTRIPSGDPRREPIRIVTRHNSRRRSSAFSARSPIPSQQQQFLIRDMSRHSSPISAHAQTRPNERMRGNTLPQVLRRTPTRLSSPEHAPQVISIPANQNGQFIRQNRGSRLPMVSTRQRFSQEVAPVHVRSRTPTVVRRPDSRHRIQTNGGLQSKTMVQPKQNVNKNDDVIQLNIQYSIDGSPKVGQPSQASVMTHAQPVLHVEQLPIQTGSQAVPTQSVPLSSGSSENTHVQKSVPVQSSQQNVHQKQQHVLSPNTIVQEKLSVMQTAHISQAVPGSGIHTVGTQTVPVSGTHTAGVQTVPVSSAHTAGLETDQVAGTQTVGTHTVPVPGTHTIGAQTVQQSLTLVQPVAPVQSLVQTSKTIDLTGNTAAASSGTQDLIFEELVNAFTDVLQQPSNKESVVGAGTPVVHGQHPQTVLQKSLLVQQQPVIFQPPGGHLGTGQLPVTIHQGRLQPPLGMIQQAGMLHQGQMMTNPMFGGHMNMMNPWMMGRMSPDMMQEMLYGDTTDPPEPVTTTTVAPPTKPAPVIPPEVTLVDTAAINVVATASPIAEVQNTTLQIASESTLVNDIPRQTSASMIPAEHLNTVARNTEAVLKVDTLQLPTTHVISPDAQQLEPAVIDSGPPIVESPTSTVPPTSSSNLGTESAAHVATITPKFPELKTQTKQVTTLPQKKTPTKSLEEKIMAEVAKMLSNQKVDMSLLPQVVDQVATEFQTTGSEVAPSATLLGLTTPGPQIATSTLTKKEKVKELIGSTRGIVVYPPTSPTLLHPTGNEAIPAKVSKSTPDVNKITFSDQTPRATIPPHADIPTLPPSKSEQNSNPDIYRTLETILNHDPAAIIKVLQEQTTLAPQASTPGPKISIHSLVDFGKLHNFTNLESILAEITSGKTVDIHQNITYIDTNANGTDFRIVSGPIDLLTGNIESLSTSTIESILNITQQSLNVEPLVKSTPVPALASSQPVQPIKQHSDANSGLSGQTGSHVIIGPFEKHAPVSNSVLAEGKSTNAANGGNVAFPVTEPKLANVEGIPVHVERIPEVTTSVDHVVQSNSNDVSGALSILKEIRSFKTVSEHVVNPSPDNDLASKLSDPNFVRQLRELLKTMIKKTGSASTTSASLVSMSTDVPDMTTMSLPVSSTEEYELDDYITTPNV